MGSGVVDLKVYSDKGAIRPSQNVRTAAPEYDLFTSLMFCLHLGVSRKHVFEEIKWINPLCKYLGVALKESKRVFDLDKF